MKWNLPLSKLKSRLLAISMPSKAVTQVLSFVTNILLILNYTLFHANQKSRNTRSITINAKRIPGRTAVTVLMRVTNLQYRHRLTPHGDVSLFTYGTDKEKALLLYKRSL